MWMMLQQDEPDDYVMATGGNHTVREFADLAFRELDMEIEWHGKNEGEKGIEKKTSKTLVEVDSRYYRLTEVDILIGDASKAKEKLGWEHKVKFEELVKIMSQADWEKVQKRGF